MTCPGVQAEQPRENPGQMARPSAEVAQCPPAPHLLCRLLCPGSGASRAPAPPDPPSLPLSKHRHLVAAAGRVLSARSAAVPRASSMLKACVSSGFLLSGLRGSLPTKTGNGNRTEASLVLDALDPRRLWDPRRPRRPSRRLGGVRTQVGWRSGLERLYPAVRGQWRPDVQPCGEALGSQGKGKGSRSEWLGGRKG